MSRRLVADPFRGWYLRESQLDVCLRMTTRAMWKAMVKNQQEEIACIRHIRQISDNERLQKHQSARAVRLVQKDYNELNAHRKVFTVYNLEKSRGDDRKKTGVHDHTRAPEPDVLAATSRKANGVHQPLQRLDVFRTGYDCRILCSKKFRKWSTNCGIRQQLETGTIKDETRTSKDETGTSKDKTGTNKDETGTSKDEAGTSKDETGTSKDEARTNKDETRTSKKTSCGCFPETTAGQSASERRNKNISFQGSPVESSSVTRVKETQCKKLRLPKLNTSVHNESTPHQGYYHHYSYDMLPWIVLNRATRGNMEMMNYPGANVSDAFKFGPFYRNWSQTLAGVKGLMKWMSRTQTGVDDVHVHVKNLLRRNSRSNIDPRLHHVVFPADCKTVYALKKLIRKRLANCNGL